MLTYFLACLVGLSLGLLGSGGSVLAVPILKFSAGLSAREAVATSLATVGAVSLIGGLLAWREGRVVWKVAGIFSLLATIGTFAGVELAKRMDEKSQMALFVLIMIIATVRMFRGQSKSSGDEPAVQESGGHPLAFFLKAFSVGLLTGVVGVGGGFLIVPALVALYHLPMKKATGTSLVVIAVNSGVGTMRYSQAVQMDWVLTGMFVAAAVFGLFIGMSFSKKLDDDKLRELFAYGLAVVSFYTLWKEFLSPFMSF